MWCQKCLTKFGHDTKYMQGNMSYMYTLEIVIVARSFRSLVKILSNHTTDPTRSQAWNKSLPHWMTNARGIGFRLGYSFRASTACEGRVKACHNPTIWHMGTLKYSHQPEYPEGFIELPTDYSLQFINSVTWIAIFTHSTVQHDVRNRWQN